MGRKQVEERLETLKDDKRLEYESASVDTNAPLALVQTNLKAKVSALEFALDNWPEE